MSSIKGSTGRAVGLEEQRSAQDCRGRRHDLGGQPGSATRLILSPPCAGAMLVDPDDGAIDDRVFEVRVAG